METIFEQPEFNIYPDKKKNSLKVTHAILHVVSFQTEPNSSTGCGDWWSWWRQSGKNSTCHEWFSKFTKSESDSENKPNSSSQEFGSDDLQALSNDDPPPPNQSTSELAEKFGVDHSTVVECLKSREKIPKTVKWIVEAKQ